MSRSSFAATWRDSAGQVIATTWGGTICWHPRKPSSMKAVSSDGQFSSIIRCGFCPGCLEFERRRLVARLVDTFKSSEDDLWLLCFDARASEVKRLSLSVRRTIGRKRCSGFYRIQPSIVAFIVSGRRPILSARAYCSGFPATYTRIRRSRGGRAFNLVTSGLLVSRDEWGENANRFYQRGLVKLDRQRFEVTTRQGIIRTSSGRDYTIRAIRGSESLHTPDAWRPVRLVRRNGEVRRRTAEPARVAATVDNLLRNLVGLEARSSQSSLSTGRASGRPNSDIKILTLAGRTVASTGARVAPLLEHASDTGRPVPSIGAGRNYYSGRRDSTSRQLREGEIDAWLARMNQIANRRGDDDDTS